MPVQVAPFERESPIRVPEAQPLRDQTHRELVYRPLQFHERSQYFIRTYNETLSAAMPLLR
jgi:hypothetical protein